MNYRETKGLIFLIFIISYIVYFLFKTYPLYSVLITGIIIYLLYRYYKNYEKSSIYIDMRGYERNKINGRLVHRTVAYNYLYNPTEYSERFRNYVVHHIDRNKRNNTPNNLQILTKEEHEKIHGF